LELIFRSMNTVKPSLIHKFCQSLWETKLPDQEWAISCAATNTYDLSFCMIEGDTKVR